MNEISIARTFTLYERRCYRCGKVWAHESRDTTLLCPKCNQYRLREYEHQIEHLRRSNASLRGALTKAKNKLKATS